LAGTESTLFTGKMQVAKARSNESGPQAATTSSITWITIGTCPSATSSTNRIRCSAGTSQVFRVAFWVRGDAGRLEPHLFYQGKEVGMVYFQGERVIQARCGEQEVQNDYDALRGGLAAAEGQMDAREVPLPGSEELGQDTGGRANANEMFMIASEPRGVTELKVLWNNKLARSIKFTVGADGRFDNGIALSQPARQRRVIVPVQILGDQDGQWKPRGVADRGILWPPFAGIHGPRRSVKERTDDKDVIARQFLKKEKSMKTITLLLVWLFVWCPLAVTATPKRSRLLSMEEARWSRKCAPGWTQVRMPPASVKRGKYSRREKPI
jgi:hypothetical protein